MMNNAKRMYNINLRCGLIYNHINTAILFIKKDNKDMWGLLSCNHGTFTINKRFREYLK